MNIKRLKIEAERLRSWDHSKRLFDMTRYVKINYVKISAYSKPRVTWDEPINACETMCCIAGDIYLNQKGYRPATTSDIHEFASKYLELTEHQADWLFCGRFTHIPLDKITPELAAQAIDLLIACDGRLYDENYEREMLP
jgi:hypothetical protein